MLMQDQSPDVVGFGFSDVSLQSQELLGFGHSERGDTSISFRDFRLWPRARLLMRGEDALCIGSRAFDLLLVLLLSRGQVVEKSEILQRVWPATTVDESNLRFQVATLRKVLGKDRDLIMSIPGRGYFFALDPAGGPRPQQIVEQQGNDGLAATATATRERLLARLEEQLDLVRAETRSGGQTQTELLSLVFHLAGMLSTGGRSPSEAPGVAVHLR